MAEPSRRGRAPRPAAGRRSRWRLVLAGIGVTLIAANLRPALTSVGPVLELLRHDIGLSVTQAAVLTTLPVLCLGAAAPAAPRLARRLGVEAALAVVLVAIICGLALRLRGDALTLFGGTVLAGSAVAMGNVLVPALVKRDFPSRVGLMMGLYTTALSGSAALAAGATVPFGAAVGHGWRGALGVWIIPAVIALAVWLPQLGGTRRVALASQPWTPLLRDRLAWGVTGYMGLQSLGFYAVVAWLPSIFQSQGYDATTAGLLLSLTTGVGVPLALVVPALATRADTQRVHVALAAACAAAGFAGLLLAPGVAPYVWALLIGVGQGVAFPLALTFIVLRSRDSHDAAGLSAMSQTVGYALAALGPLLVGFLHEVTGSWSWSVGLLLALLVPQLASGWPAGRPGFVTVSGTVLGRRGRG